MLEDKIKPKRKRVKIHEIRVFHGAEHDPAIQACGLSNCRNEEYFYGTHF